MNMDREIQEIIGVDIVEAKHSCPRCDTTSDTYYTKDLYRRRIFLRDGEKVNLRLLPNLDGLPEKSIYLFDRCGCGNMMYATAVIQDSRLRL